MNVLDFFRLVDKNPARKAKFILDCYGSTAKTAAKYGKHQVLNDIMQMIYLNMGAPEEVGRFLDDYINIINEIDKQGKSDKIALKNKK